MKKGAKILLGIIIGAVVISAVGKRSDRHRDASAAVPDTTPSVVSVAPSPAPTPTPTKATSPTPTPVATDAGQQDIEEAAETAEAVSDPPVAAAETPESIRPEFKEAMDSYEAFFDEYVAFMEQFRENPGDLELLAAYADYMAQYTETMQKLDALGEGDMNNAELAYYLEVTARIEQKLLSVLETAD